MFGSLFVDRDKYGEALFLCCDAHPLGTFAMSNEKARSSSSARLEANMDRSCNEGNSQIVEHERGTKRSSHLLG